MFRTKKKNIPDQRIEWLIQEINEISHNGLPSELNRDKILAIVRQAIQNCPVKYRQSFAEKSLTILRTLLNYKDSELLLALNPKLEKKILDSVKEWIKKQSQKSVNMAGFVIHWTWQTATRITRTVLEPAATQLTLGFSLIVQPIPDSSLLLKSERSESTRPAMTKETTAIITKNSYDELRLVHDYSDETLDALSRYTDIANSRKPQHASLKHNPADNLLEPKPPKREKLVLNVERGRLESIRDLNRKKEDNDTRLPERSVKEIRSQREIHTILIENEHRFENCLKPFRTTNSAKLQRVSVKFEILPSGTVTRIEFLRGKENDDLNDRLKIQLMQLRFSKVDAHLGNQTVYHSFFY